MSVGVLSLAVCLTPFNGCGAPQIPNAVSDREYQVYSAWIKHRFENKAPKALFLYSRTFVFDPLTSYGCGDTLHQQDAIRWDMIRRLHDLGTAEYLLDFDFNQPNFRIAWDHRVVDSPPSDPEFGYDALSFSRVAFNRAGDKALFAVSDQCGAGLCGKGGAVLASKLSSVWHFQNTGVVGCSEGKARFVGHKR